MKLESDNLCKLLAEQNPQAFAAWLLGKPLSAVRSARVLKTELSIEPVRADSLIFLRLPREILHLEFTVSWPKEPPLEIRMLDYWVRGYRLYRVPIHQFVILLRPTRRELPSELRVGNTWHRYTVIKLWEQDPAPLLKSPALLPLAPLARAKEPVELLKKTLDRVARIASPDERREVELRTHLLAGLRFEEQLLNTLFREEVMIESVTYRAILRKGATQGRLEEAQSLLSLLVGDRFGQVSESLKAQLSELTLKQTEELVRALPRLRRPDGLTRWLKQHASV